MITTIYYILALFPILWEMLNLKDTKTVQDFSKNLKETKGNKSYTQQAFSVFMLGYWIWTMVGLFTSQWPLYLLLIILGFAPKHRIWLRKTDALLSLLILLFILINHYHLHTDVYGAIKALLK